MPAFHCRTLQQAPHRRRVVLLAIVAGIALGCGTELPAASTPASPALFANIWEASPTSLTRQVAVERSTWRLEGQPLDPFSESTTARRRRVVPIQLLSAPATPHVDVPEPMLFDLVRPLGARQGELEINLLSVFPWSHSTTDRSQDPFGSAPTTPDRGGIEWAPEIEYAIFDGFAIEFELPFENSHLEEYKLGLQWTIGTALDDRYIHGFQVLVQPTYRWDEWNSSLLYLAGMRFDDTWSALVMVGARMNLEGSGNAQTFERIVNASIFADVAASLRVGLESNYASKLDGTAEFILVPQVHWEITEQFEIQSGLGFGTFSEGSEQSFILRAIVNW